MRPLIWYCLDVSWTIPWPLYENRRWQPHSLIWRRHKEPKYTVARCNKRKPSRWQLFISLTLLLVCKQIDESRSTCDVTSVLALGSTSVDDIDTREGRSAAPGLIIANLYGTIVWLLLYNSCKRNPQPIVSNCLKCATGYAFMGLFCASALRLEWMRGFVSLKCYICKRSPL